MSSSTCLEATMPTSPAWEGARTMATWVFEPGHTAVEFRARHMMVCWVRGHMKDIHGSLEFDPDHPAQLSIQATIDATKLWSGEPQRDGHLKSSDFLD